MMRGSSRHDDLNDESDRCNQEETETHKEDLAAAITAALTEGDGDDHDGNDNDDVLDQELQDTVIDFSLHSDDLNEKSIMDEAMKLLSDEKSLHDSMNKKFNDDATQSSMASFSSVDFATDGDVEPEECERRNGSTNQQKANQTEDVITETVPIQQFENALALIQDLEKQVDALEAMKHRLLIQNEELRQQNQTQSQIVAAYEKKLSEFPKLMEATIEEQTAVAHHVAKGAAKQSFWNEYMSRQEEQSREEKKRRATATTNSLKQSDFLKNVVERQEQEKSKSLFQGWKPRWSPMGQGVKDPTDGEHTGNGSGSHASKGVKQPNDNPSHLGIVAKESNQNYSTNEKILNLLT
jgi:hypothetical protein